MARLERDSSPITAAQQFGAVAWLRWRLFANGFRRKGGKGELVARIFVFPFAALFVIGPVVGSTAAAYYAAINGHLEYLTGIFWGIFVIQVLVSINISPPSLSFDPESLIRFPLNFSRYLTIRLSLGLLSASTIVGSCALLGAATGGTIAIPALGPYFFGSAVSLALCNMLFIRMLFAWIDRWLSTRRARELFMVLIFVFSIGIQYVNVTVNGLGRHTSRAERQAKIDAMMRVYHFVEPYLRALPPALAGSAVLRGKDQQLIAALALIAAILAFAAVFLGVFGWRMLREYRGENLSEAAKSQPQQEKVNHPARPRVAVHAEPQPSSPSFLSPIVAALFEKEWIYIRRNPAQFYGLAAPLAMVFIFAGRMGSFARTGFIFPSAVAYSVLGVAALAYNVLGLDASGVQFYFLAPIKMRSVLLAKNLFSFAITGLQLVLVYGVISFTSTQPPILITISTTCWVVLACLVNATVGNMRSIIAPKKIDPSKISRKQASQLSALMCVGIMVVLGAMGAGIIFLGQFLNLAWLPIPILVALAFGAFALYITGLNNVDQLALAHRESLVEELSKAS